MATPRDEFWTIGTFRQPPRTPPESEDTVEDTDEDTVEDMDGHGTRVADRRGGTFASLL